MVDEGSHLLINFCDGFGSLAQYSLGVGANVKNGHGYTPLNKQMLSAGTIALEYITKPLKLQSMGVRSYPKMFL
jgi:hypothetical protein